MKKFLALLLSLVMVLSLAACGDDKEDKKEKEPSSKTENVDAQSDDDDSETENEAETGTVADEVEISEDLINFLSQVTIVVPTDFVGTGWEFSGGMVDGTEMDEDQAAQNLEDCGGQLNIVFNDDENVSLVQGNGTLEGIYGPTDNESVIGFVFADDAGNTEVYAGLFTEVEGTVVLMLFPDGSGKNAVYFTQITES